MSLRDQSPTARKKSARRAVWPGGQRWSFRLRRKESCRADRGCPVDENVAFVRSSVARRRRVSAGS
jgi:hypothetical protein